MLGNVAKRLKSSEEQSAVAVHVPSYEEVRCQLTRHRTVRCTPIPDPLNLPDTLRTTLRGRSVAEGDVNWNEPFLMYTGQGGRMYVLCAKTELAVLHDSKYLVCDGTFEMSPDTAYQVYTVHGFCNGEGMALLWALLPNKSTATYVELFTAIRSALVSQFGDVGHKTFLVDFKLAAINAIQQTFPESVVKGCSFHFRQALMRRIQSLGLKSVYESDEYPEVRRWFRLIMSMTMLPAFAIPMAWSCLSNPPFAGDSDVDGKTRTFAVYVGATWITGDYPPTLWSHFDNLGPRTTNLTEGWHNGINSRFGMPHPSLRCFLDWLQKCQFEVQFRGIQLLAGRPPKQKLPVYQKVNEELAAAKLRYNMNSSSVFVHVFPSENAWPIFYQMTIDYLSHISHLVGACMTCCLVN